MVTLKNILEHFECMNVPEKKFNTIYKLLKNDLYKDENEILCWLIHNKAKQKIEYYEKKISEMEIKYEVDFFTFENRICSNTEENLELWNDLILWGGYIKAYNYWKEFY